MSRASLLLSIALGLTLAAVAHADTALTPENVEFFEKKVRPLLVEHCHKCHSAEAEEPGGELLLDSREGWTKGGYSGTPILPGEPEKSLLVTAVRHVDLELQMPPDRKLPQEAINTLVEWIRRGAPDPREGQVAKPRKLGEPIDIEAGRRHWAFQPPVRPTLPQVKEAGWPQSPIDRFILARLEEKGLRPAAPAEPRKLLRRLTFDLTGLPPTPQDTAVFLARAEQDLPSAVAECVDRLLASPQYGERWGRHWLDVARYADSNGLDENVALGNAWRYRDWVVAALNDDLPYDQFVLQQLAGDLLMASSKSQRYQQLAATGFLSLGAKVLAESDLEKMRMDIIDEQIDTVGRSLLGLTLGCARCHDHKFDPIPTTDYYALAGIFRSTRTMETYNRIAKWLEHSIPTPDEERKLAEHQDALAKKKQEIAKLVQSANEQLVAESGAEGKLPEKPEEKYPEATKAELKKLRDELAALEKAPPEVSSTMGVMEDQICDVAVHIRGSHLRKGDVVQRRFPLVLSDAKQSPLPKDRSGRLEFAQWLTSGKHPLTSRVIVNRIWRWHFGQGLVASTDNFGLLGEAPLNQPLLDWLAVDFEENGWSLKRLHRLIALSSAYQMSDAYDATAAATDPENRLLWRFSPRRHEAEVLRDSLLAVSSGIDLTMGGTLLKLKNREFVFDHTSKDNTTYDPRRRSIYLPVIRNNLCDTFSLFDYPDPAVSSGSRAETTTAPQALYMMNGEIIVGAAERMAESVSKFEGDDGSRVRWVYEQALTRQPNDSELQRALQFVAAFTEACQRQKGDMPAEQAHKLAWQALCQAVLASNEFAYLQ